MESDALGTLDVEAGSIDVAVVFAMFTWLRAGSAEACLMIFTAR